MVSKQKVAEAIPESQEPGHFPQTTDNRVAPPAGLSEAAKQWIEENQEAIRSSNEYVEKQGLPLAKYRLFPWRD